jgi:hypothetical protein
MFSAAKQRSMRQTESRTPFPAHHNANEIGGVFGVELLHDVSAMDLDRSGGQSGAVVAVGEQRVYALIWASKAERRRLAIASVAGIQ